MSLLQNRLIKTKKKLFLQNAIHFNFWIIGKIFLYFCLSSRDLLLEKKIAISFFWAMTTKKYLFLSFVIQPTDGDKFGLSFNLEMAFRFNYTDTSFRFRVFCSFSDRNVWEVIDCTLRIKNVMIKNIFLTFFVAFVFIAKKCFWVNHIFIPKMIDLFLAKGLINDKWMSKVFEHSQNSSLNSFWYWQKSAVLK